MANAFKELKVKLSLDAQAKVVQKTEEMLQEMPLQKLRQDIGGESEIVARFPEGSVKIQNFSDI